MTFYAYQSHTYRDVGRRAIPDIVVRFVRDYLTRYVQRVLYQCSPGLMRW